jgi:hypothetical protein
MPLYLNMTHASGVYQAELQLSIDHSWALTSIYHTTDLNCNRDISLIYVSEYNVENFERLSLLTNRPMICDFLDLNPTTNDRNLQFHQDAFVSFVEPLDPAAQWFKRPSNFITDSTGIIIDWSEAIKVLNGIANVASTVCRCIIRPDPEV